MNIYTTPDALQCAGAKLYNVINATFFTANPTITEITCTGDIQVHTIYNGLATTEIYSNLTDTAVSLKADAETLVRIVGDVTAITFPYDGHYPGDTSGQPRLKTIITANCRSLKSLTVKSALNLTSLDLSKNTALTYLDCSYCKITSLDLSKNTALTSLYCRECTGITSLDLSKNTALTTLDCTSCTSLTSLRCNAYNEGVTSNLSAEITNATSTTGTVTVFAPLTYASTIKTAATTKGWSYTEQETA